MGCYKGSGVPPCARPAAMGAKPLAVVARHHVQRIGTDGARGAQDGDFLLHECAKEESIMASGRVGSRASTRSSTPPRSEEHTSELQSPCNLVCRLLLEKKKTHLSTITMRS